jgi:hypothetical protein
MEDRLEINDNLHCCGLQEIDDLQSHDSPKEAMEDFCSATLSKNMYTGRITNNMGNIYIFSGVERVSNAKIKTYKNGQAEPETLGWVDPVKIKYASEFAAFIRRNKLGVVKESPARSNRLNHPNHMLKCYIFCPDGKAISKWFLQNNR